MKKQYAYVGSNLNTVKYRRFKREVLKINDDNTIWCYNEYENVTKWECYELIKEPELIPFTQDDILKLNIVYIKSKRTNEIISIYKIERRGVFIVQDSDVYTSTTLISFDELFIDYEAYYNGQWQPAGKVKE